MNMNTFALIIIIAGGLLLIFGIFKMVPWYSIFAHFYANNPMRCKVYLHYGQDCDYVIGEYAYVDDKYCFYNYVYKKERMSVAIRQADMHLYSYMRGYLMIHVKFGEGVSILDNPDKKVNDKIVNGQPEYPQPSGDIKANIGAVELNGSVRGKVGVDLVRSVSSRSRVSWGVVLVIIIIAVAGFLFFKQYQENQAEKVQQQQQSQVTQTPDERIEEILRNEGLIK